MESGVGVTLDTGDSNGCGMVEVWTRVVEVLTRVVEVLTRVEVVEVWTSETLNFETIHQHEVVVIDTRFHDGSDP
jgi:hypothetical protein